MGTAPVDSLDATGRNQRQGLNWVLFSSADLVAGAMEPMAAAHMGAAPTDLFLPAGERTALW